jgi:diguanylate cyclase (GGDEF)-like protein/PAS domain S-box-containing protein
VGHPVPVAETLRVPAALVYRDFTVLAINPAFLEKLGKTKDEVVGQPCFRVFCAREGPPENCPVARSLGSKRQETLTLLSPGEQARWATAIPLLDRRGEPKYILLLHLDMAEQQRLAAWRRIAARLLESTGDGVLILDKDLTIQWVNPAFTRLTGYEFAEIVGQNAAVLRSERHDEAFCQGIWAAVAREGRWEGEFWYRHKNGEISPRWLTVSAVYDEEGQLTHCVAVYSAPAQKANNFLAAQHFTHHDSLTGLGNRLQLYDRFALVSAHAQRLGLVLAAFYLDLDGFKDINRALGYAAGDRVLEAVARRLRSAVRPDDTVVRVGSDEFVLLLLLKQPTDATALASKLLQTLEPPIRLDGEELSLTASVGIALFPRDAQDAEGLVRAACSAMERARERGRNTVEFYSPGLEEAAVRRFTLEQELRRTLEETGILVYYQPRVNLFTGKVAGVEALVRWLHPRRGLLLPRDFIAIAEETDLIFPMGKRVLEVACAQVKAWEEALGQSLSLSVNLSARQFHHPELLAAVKEVLSQTGFDPACLELEITESTAIRDLESTRRAIRSLADLGVGIAIDDFGVGYCALNYLKYFPVKALKIDRSFVQGIGQNLADEAITATVIALAHNLRCQAVAEGVETEEQLLWLRDRQCDEAQGFYFSPPLPPEEVERMLKPGGRLLA